MAEFAPIGMTLDDGVVRSTRQPGQPGRPRTAVEAPPQDNPRPTLREVAADTWRDDDLYHRPVYTSDPRYSANVETDAALNLTREMPLGVAFGSSAFRSLRSWASIASASPLVTDAEWEQLRGARALEKPANMSYLEAVRWVQKHDADMLAERINRQGRNPWVQTLVGAVAGGVIDPVNVAAVGTGAAAGAALRVGRAAVGAVGAEPALQAAGGALKSLGVTQFGARMARHSAAVAGASVVGEAGAAVPFELAIADRYGEEYGVADFAAEVGVAGALSLVAGVAGRSLRNVRLSRTDEITARARAESEAAGNPDSDVVTPDEVAKALDPTPLDDMPADSGKAPPPPPEFRAALIETWESGLDDPTWSRLEGRAAQRGQRMRETVGEQHARAMQTWNEVTDFEQVAERLARKGEAPMTVPAAKAVVRQSVASRLTPLTDQVRNRVRGWAKQVAKTPKGLLDRPGRFGIFVRENNVTTPRIRTLVAEMLETAGMPRKNAEGLSAGLTRDEAAAWIDTFITTATREEYNIPAAIRPLVGDDMVPVVIADQIDAVQATRSRPERAAHIALDDIAWNGADSRAMRRLEDWLRQTGVLLPGTPSVRPALRQAAADYAAAVRLDPEAHPFDFIQSALDNEDLLYMGVDRGVDAPEVRAAQVVEARERGDVVAPTDVVPLRDLAGSQPLAGPDIALEYRAHTEAAVREGKIGDVALDEVDRTALSDLLTSVDNLANMMTRCVKR